MIKYILILLFFISVSYCLSINKNIENMTCVINSELTSDDLKNTDYEKYSRQILGFFTTETNYFDDNKTLEKYLLGNNVKQQDLNNVVNFIGVQINNNNPDISNYVFNKDSSLRRLRNIYFRDNFINSLSCMTPDVDKRKDFFNELINIITIDANKSCSLTSFQKHCYDKYKEIYPKGDIRFFNSKNIGNMVNNFDDRIFGDDLRSILKNYLKDFTNTYSRSLVKTEADDFKTLVKDIVIPNIKSLIEKLNQKNNTSEYNKLYKEFEQKKSVFSYLVTHYVLVNSYQDIKTNVPDGIKLDKALMCCEKSDNDYCFSFSKDVNKPNPIIYGYKNLGFAKLKDCDNEFKVQNYDIKLDEHLSKKFDFWKAASKPNKDAIYEKFNKYIKYFNINFINLQNMKISDIITYDSGLKEKDKFRSEAFKKLPQVEFNLELLVNAKELNDVKDKINASTTITQIQKILKEYNIDETSFDLTTSTNLEITKLAAYKIINIYMLLKIIGMKSPNIPNIIKEILGVTPGTETFKTIFIKYNIPERTHQKLFSNIIELLKNISLLQISNDISLDSIPSKSITYTQSFFPLSSEFNICKNWESQLDKLRKDRIITFDQYAEYAEKLMEYCDNNKSLEPEVIEDLEKLMAIDPKTITDFNKIAINGKVGLPNIVQRYNTFGDFLNDKDTEIGDNFVSANNPGYNIYYSIYGKN